MLIPNTKPWVTPELKELFNKKNQVIKDKQMSKQIQKLIDEKLLEQKQIIRTRCYHVCQATSGKLGKE